MSTDVLLDTSRCILYSMKANKDTNDETGHANPSDCSLCVGLAIGYVMLYTGVREAGMC